MGPCLRKDRIVTLILHDTDSIISVFDIKDHVSLQFYVHFL